MIASDKARAYLRMSLAGGVGAKTIQRLVQAFGSAEGVASASAGAWRRVQGVGPKTAAGLEAVTEQTVEEELQLVSQAGAHVICIEDDAYPEALRNIFDPPAILYVRGRLEPQDATAMGVVGSRRCTHYGMEQAERFGALLGRAGFTVVSGGARGIDSAAHRGALTAGGRTLAVMGCGLNHCYPKENAELFERIVREDRGALISEFGMNSAPQAGNFPQRNRIISGLSLGVLVIEAANPSGALITAREAAEQGKEIFALPGRVDSPTSAGTHQLLRDGARLTADLDDILGALGEVGRALAPDEPALETTPLFQNLTPEQEKLLRVLGERAMTLDELIREANVPAAAVLSEMTLLAVRGLVRQEPGNRFARKH